MRSIKLASRNKVKYLRNAISKWSKTFLLIIYELFDPQCLCKHFLFIANKRVHSEAYGCSYKGCDWDTGKQGKDWDYYSTTNGNCTYCMNECDQDTTCEGVECGGDHCSWWKNGKCDEAHEHTLSSNGVDKMCVKKRDFRGKC